MLDLLALIIITSVSIRLYLGFSNHTALLNEFKLSNYTRQLVLLMPLAPFVFMLGALYGSPILGLIVAMMIPALTWYRAHAQYHFLDAQGTARVQGLQKCFSTLEFLSLLTAAYLVAYFLFIITLQVISRQ